MFKVILKSKGSRAITNMDKYKGEIVYGVPRETAYKREDNNNLDRPVYNNAQILALMEHGSIINKIPKRELLKPVREKHKEEIEKALRTICVLIMRGNSSEADMQMEKLALRIENWTKKFFVDPDNGWAPNAPITIHGGWMKNKATGKPVYIKGKKSDKPLIDTGSLRQSIKAIYYKEGR